MKHTGVEGRAAELCRDTARRLTEAGVPIEHLAEFVPARRRLWVLTLPASMRPLSEVWRLGRLLLDRKGQLYSGGRITRAAERGRLGYQSLSREERRDIAAAALRGGYEAGTAVNFDALPLPLELATLESLGSDSPLVFAGGELRVRWHIGADAEMAPTLDRYLRERSELLLNPPLGAS